MAGGAGDAVAGQGAVASGGGGGVAERPGGCVDHVAGEGRAGLARRCGSVDAELALALHAVAAEAGVLDHGGGGGMEGIDLAGELGEEDGVAAGEAHGGAAPGGVGRQVQEFAAGSGGGHVELQLGPGGAVATDALVGGQELRVRGGAAGGGEDVVVGGGGEGDGAGGVGGCGFWGGPGRRGRQ